MGGRLKYFVHEKGKNNTRSMGSFSVKRRSQTGIYSKTSFYRNSANKCQCSKRSYFTVGGRKIVAKGAIEPVPPGEMKTGFYSTFFCSPKENGRFETNHKSETSEQVSKETAFQNGLSKQSHKPSTTRRLGNFNRSGRCLSTYTHPCKIQKIPTFLYTRKSLPIHQSLFRSNSSTKDIYEDSVGNCGTFKTAKCPSSSISRRLVFNKPVEKVTTDRQRESTQSSCQTRSYDQVGKISISSKSKSNIHRGSFSVGQRNCLSNIRKNSENRTSNFSDNPGTNSTQFPSPSGFNGFMHRADPECSVIYETDTTPSSAFLETSNKGSPSKSPNNSTSVGSLEMVAKSRERETILPRSQFKISYYRCLQARVRRSTRKSHLSGDVVQRRTKVTHKPSGTQSSSFVTPEISASLKRSQGTSSVRQHNGCSIPEQTGRYQISPVVSTDMESIATSNQKTMLR